MMCHVLLTQSSRSSVQCRLSPVSGKWKHLLPSSFLLSLVNKRLCAVESPVMWMTDQATAAWHVTTAFVWCCTRVPLQWRRDGMDLSSSWRNPWRDAAGVALIAHLSLRHPGHIQNQSVFLYSQAATPSSFSVSLRYWQDGSLHPQGRGGITENYEESRGRRRGTYGIKRGNGKMTRGMGRHKIYSMICWAISNKEIECIACISDGFIAHENSTSLLLPI